MKIAFVYDAIYPYIKGGGEKRYYEIAKQLTAKGHQVHLYGMKLWEGPNLIQKEGIYLHGIAPNMPLYTKKGRRSIIQALIFGVSCLKLISEDFDVIDCCGFPYFSLFSCRLVSILKGKKLNSTLFEVWGKNYWVKYMGKLGYISYIVEKLGVLMPDKIISVSEHTKIKLQNDLKSQKPIVTIPNGIDFESIQKVQPSSMSSDIIFAGRLLSHKNVDYLIRAVRLLTGEMPNIKCLIVGAGPEKKNLLALIKEFKLEQNISILPFFPHHDDLYALMKSSRIFVLPSTREGFGIIVLEANACGIPVITNSHKNNAAKDLITEGKNGYLISSNIDDNAIKMLALIANHKKYEITSIAIAEQYDWNKVTNQIEEVYL